MYKIGDYLVYKKDICKVKEIRTNHLNNNDYYILSPIDDESLIIDVPIQNKCGNIRNLFSEEEINKIIEEIPNISIIETDSKNIESEYKNLLLSNSCYDLIKIIKTAYLRNKERLDNKRKIGEKDDMYFKLAEKYLYNEFSFVLGISVDEVRNYIIKKVSSIEK